MSDDLSFPFDPQWCLSPCVTLREWMTGSGRTVRSLAKELGVSKSLVGNWVSNKSHYDADIAVKLGALSGVSPEFWWNLRNNYLLGLAKGLTDSTPDVLEFF